MKLRTALSILAEVKRTYLVPFYKKKLFSADPRDLFFSDGWGDDQLLNQLKAYDIIGKAPKDVKITWTEEKNPRGYIKRIGTFSTPFPHSYLPPECHKAEVKMYLPLDHNLHTPLTIIFPMTGEEGFDHRAKSFSKPLLKKGIATVLLENPFYGKRRASYQKSFIANTVQDILTMCLAAVEEGRSLTKYFYNMGYSKIGVSGLSQGGMLAAIVGSTVRFPIGIASGFTPHTPEVIFTEGLLKNLVNWKALGLSQDNEAKTKFRELFQIGDLTTNLPKPPAGSAIYLQGARRDLVVPKHSVEKLHQAWPDSKLIWLPGTHITSLALRNQNFRKLIEKSLS